MTQTTILTRRQFLMAGAAGVAALSLPGLLQAAGASVAALTHLNPTRFIAGLLFDKPATVLLEEMVDSVVNLLVDGRKYDDLKHKVSTCAGLCAGRAMRHDNYKAAVIISGVADYHAWKERQRQRQLEVLLKDQAQMTRFQAALDYLRDEHINVQLAGQEYARPLGRDVTPDELLTLDGPIAAGRDQLQHYAALIDTTGTHAFKKWVV